MNSKADKMNWADVINETLRYLEENLMTFKVSKEAAGKKKIEDP